MPNQRQYLVFIFSFLAAISLTIAAEDTQHLHVAYDYPPQSGLEHITKTDPQRSLLTDRRTGTSGPSAVWGKWGGREMLIDWTFATPVRVKTMRAVIVHPSPQSDNSHASAVRIHALAGPGDFLTEPDFSRDIPFETGALQEVRITFPDSGIVADRLRTTFIAGRHQVVLSEVSFETEPVTPEVAARAQQARIATQPETFSPVVWLPRPLAPDARVSGDSIFGVCGHFLHTNAFYPGNNPRFNNHWRPSHTLPWLVEGNFNWIREALYLSMFRTTGKGASHATGTANRARVENYLQRYQDRGLKVLLCPMFGGGQIEGFEDTADWIAQLARRFPAVRAVELHNEPNLKGFWKSTPQDFVDTARAFTARVKATAPQVPIIAGSFAGWGGAWQHDDLKELLPGPREIATRYAEEVFKLGLLEFADAISAHPYRGHSAPEGGEVLESPTDPDGFAKEIRNWLDLAAKHTPGGKRLPFYITEIGYSVSAQGYTNVPTESRQADYISRLMLVLLGVKLDGVPLEAVFWYDLKQDEMPDSHYESNFGIVAPNTSRPRPAWLAMRRVNEFFANTADFNQPADATPPQFSNGPDLIKNYIWRRTSDGALIVPFWRMNQLMKKDADFDSELRLTLPAGLSVANVQLHDLHEDRPRSTGWTQKENVLRIPLHVTARAAWLEIKAASK
ncbi:cellulase family glycosylhydrolase [Geminisphaera colitermitum]|uniref:cellulase family glycosylhydrolase n=1 Tax=Geminisphaera colitermitum TaxID=1148786 RepID=UPI00019653DB|nr:cellulase family glycosylhydrolase [Geminisphaera colitermitum]